MCVCAVAGKDFMCCRPDFCHVHEIPATVITASDERWAQRLPFDLSGMTPFSGRRLWLLSEPAPSMASSPRYRGGHKKATVACRPTAVDCHVCAGGIAILAMTKPLPAAGKGLWGWPVPACGGFTNRHRRSCVCPAAGLGFHVLPTSFRACS
jgi:hypothetical protein